MTASLDGASHHLAHPFPGQHRLGSAAVFPQGRRAELQFALDVIIRLIGIVVVDPQALDLGQVSEAAYLAQRGMTPMKLGGVFLVEVGTIVHQYIGPAAEVRQIVQELLVSEL